tara:strand:- start:53 stop:382 length:330 start_codon:yes stop_codon:yes gene_type:complete
MDGRISSCADVLDAFSDFDDDNKDNITEENIITETLKLLNSIGDNPLYYYCILKTVLTKKHLLTDVNKKELIDILDIKPIVKDKIVYREKIVYKDYKYLKKPKKVNDDY